MRNDDVYIDKIMLSSGKKSLVELKIIANIFNNLSAKELRDARLLSSSYNHFVTSTPELYWAKHVLRIKIHTPAVSSNSNTCVKQEWTRLSKTRLLAKYKCPNFHFVKSNLHFPGSIEFFQEKVLQRIKHLKLSKCSVSLNELYHIISYNCRSLKYLEIEDSFKADDLNDCTFSIEWGADSTTLQPLKSFKTLILRNSHSKKDYKDLPLNFLRSILHKTVCLEVIRLQGWKARTFHSLVKVLSSMNPENIEKLQVLELSCVVEDKFSFAKQYSFITQLEWIPLFSLQEITIQFDEPIHLASSTVSENSIEALTLSLAKLAEGSSETLKILQLTNCPVTNALFRSGTNLFPRLFEIETRGTFIMNLDPEPTSVPYQLSHLRSRISQIQSSNMGVGLMRDRLPLAGRTNTNARNSTVMDSVSRQGIENDETDVTPSPRSRVYKIICCVLTSIIFLHYAVKFLPVGLLVQQNLEILIQSLVICWILSMK